MQHPAWLLIVVGLAVAVIGAVWLLRLLSHGWESYREISPWSGEISASTFQS